MDTPRRLKKTWLGRGLVFFTSLCTVAKAEEESILTVASVLDFGKFVESTGNDLIGDGFKTEVKVTCCSMVDVTVDLKQEIRLVSAEIANRGNHLSS